MKNMSVLFAQKALEGSNRYGHADNALFLFILDASDNGYSNPMKKGRRNQELFSIGIVSNAKINTVKNFLNIIVIVENIRTLNLNGI